MKLNRSGRRRPRFISNACLSYSEGRGTTVPGLIKSPIPHAKLKRRVKKITKGRAQPFLVASFAISQRGNLEVETLLPLTQRRGLCLVLGTGPCSELLIAGICLQLFLNPLSARWQCLEGRYHSAHVSEELQGEIYMLYTLSFRKNRLSSRRSICQNFIQTLDVQSFRFDNFY